MKNIFKYISILMSAILPVAAFISFKGIYDFNLYNYLWCGFYGCILVLLLFKSKIYKSIIIILNLPVILFCGYASLMGGFYGLGLTLLNMIIPFYSVLLYYLRR